MNKLHELRRRLGGKIGKDASGQFGGYASLEHIFEVLDPILDELGLYRHEQIDFEGNEGSCYLKVSICDAKDGTVHSSSRIILGPEKAGPQGMGAAITYMRRYLTLVVCGLATADDPDAVLSSKNSSLIKPYSQAVNDSNRATLDSVRRARGPEEEGLDFQIAFGKFKGCTIREAGVSEVRSYVNWIKSKAKESGEGLSANAEELDKHLSLAISQSQQKIFVDNEVPF